MDAPKGCRRRRRCRCRCEVQSDCLTVCTHTSVCLECCLWACVRAYCMRACNKVGRSKRRASAAGAADPSLCVPPPPRPPLPRANPSHVSPARSNGCCRAPPCCRVTELSRPRLVLVRLSRSVCEPHDRPRCRVAASWERLLPVACFICFFPPRVPSTDPHKPHVTFRPQSEQG